MNSPPAIPFGDYLVFVDESGDHSLTSINPQHPVFVLAFVIIKKTDYVRQVCPAFQEFKMRYWGHDEVVLHEHEIRKPQDAFSFLQIKPLREKFMRELTVIMEELPATVVAVVIDKTAFLSAHASPEGVYDYAMEIGINAIFSFLQRHDNSDAKTPVVVECRGRKEDKELELAFRRFCDSGKGHNRPLPFDLVMIPKTSNSAGLQLADLVARPIGIKHIRPQQLNRAYDIIQAKLDRVGNDEPEGYGLITIP